MANSPEYIVSLWLSDRQVEILKAETEHRELMQDWTELLSAIAQNAVNDRVDELTKIQS